MVTIPILTQAGVIPIDLLTSKINYYIINFYDDYGSDAELIWSTGAIKRGDKVDYSGLDALGTPEKKHQVPNGLYVFAGWDLTNDHIVDILPKRLYSTFAARPVFIEYEPEQSSSDKFDYGYTITLNGEALYETCNS